jgi:hypothetical protein
VGSGFDQQHAQRLAARAQVQALLEPEQAIALMQAGGRSLWSQSMKERSVKNKKAAQGSLSEG